MEKLVRKINMDIRRYELGDTYADYLVDEYKRVSLQLIPKSKEELRTKPWEKEPSPFNARAKYSNCWSMGRIAYFHLVGENTASPGFTMKNNYIDLKLVSQQLKAEDNKKVIETLLETPEGYKVLHKLTYIEGFCGFMIDTEFINDSGRDVTLDMLSSFALDNLSPFQSDDAPNTYSFHRFQGGWSMEGRHICDTIEDLALEKAWAGFVTCYNNLKFGSKGSYPTKKYFPVAAFEDKQAGVIWAAQIAHNATWQMEVTRWDDTLSFTGGLGDRDFCGWKKNIKNGESFKAPQAYVSAVAGDIFDACAGVTDMMKPAQEAYGEKGVPTAFNEYCSTWGRPTQEKMLNFCKVLKPYGIKYLVIDAGWCQAGNEQEGNGEWPIDKTIFPDMKGMNKIIRENGMIPGIWFEFEVTTEGSKMFLPEYDYMHLTKDGSVLKSNEVRSYWDFRREDVREYLYEKVIKMLKDNDFGYIKVDYNANIGISVDGAESGAEGLRAHLECVRDFFKKMKEEIPDLIIENCASGGHRLEPSMMGVSGVSSFSDAHESVEIPYIAANLHNLMLPVQSLIWAVLRSDESVERTVYSLAATFLGRMCLSGDVCDMKEENMAVLKNATEFYPKLENIIKNGRTKIYGNRGKSMRYPTGVQVVARKTDDEMLVVYHAFENDLKDIEIDIPENFKVKSEFYADCIKAENGKLKISKAKPFTAGAVILGK